MLGFGGLEGITQASGVLDDGGAGKMVVAGYPWLGKPGEGNEEAGDGEGKGPVEVLG